MESLIENHFLNTSSYRAKNTVTIVRSGLSYYCKTIYLKSPKAIKAETNTRHLPHTSHMNKNTHCWWWVK
jgi:hypothetical protein